MLVCRTCKPVEVTLSKKAELSLPFFASFVSSPLLNVLSENALFILMFEFL